MAAVSTANDKFDIKDCIVETEEKLDKNGVGETEIPLSPDHAAEEARKEEIKAKIKTVSSAIYTPRNRFCVVLISFNILI